MKVSEHGPLDLIAVYWKEKLLLGSHAVALEGLDAIATSYAAMTNRKKIMRRSYLSNRVLQKSYMFLVTADTNRL